MHIGNRNEQRRRFIEKAFNEQGKNTNKTNPLEKALILAEIVGQNFYSDFQSTKNFLQIILIKEYLQK